MQAKRIKKYVQNHKPQQHLTIQCKAQLQDQNMDAKLVIQEFIERILSLNRLLETTKKDFKAFVESIH
jgi:hypothetical protein